MDPLWRLIETCHAVVYYAPEREAEYSALGLKGGWMGYFASRAGALGAVGPDVVTACFYGFAPTMVARALPDAWRYASPEEAVEARLRVVDAALRRLLGDAADSRLVEEAAELACRAVGAAAAAGRPLFAAHAALPKPGTPLLQLFWASTALREHRGDGHCAALLTAGIDGCESHVLTASLGLVPEDQRFFRGWTETQWAEATARLVDRGWLDARGRLTPSGRQQRADVESTTEALARPALSALDGAAQQRLAASLAPLADRIVSAGGLPFPNGMGLPPL